MTKLLVVAAIVALLTNVSVFAATPLDQRVDALEKLTAEHSLKIEKLTKDLSATNVKVDDAHTKITDLTARTEKLEALLEKAVGWDCAATCEIYRTMNSSYVLADVETVSGHGINAAEAMAQLVVACDNALKAIPYAKVNQLVDSHHKMASIKNSCALSMK